MIDAAMEGPSIMSMFTEVITLASIISSGMAKFVRYFVEEADKEYANVMVDVQPTTTD